MAALVFRISLLAIGLALAELGLDAFARGSAIALVELGAAIGMLVAGSAGFIVPLLGGGDRREVRGD